MQKNIFLYILCTFIFSANNNFIFHEGQLIESNTIIIKFSNTYAPLLGKEEPLNIEYIQPFQTIDNENFKSLIPLFSHIKDFKNLHYEHELHKYYKLILHNHDETFTQIISDLNNLDIIENVEFNGVAEA